MTEGPIFIIARNLQEASDVARELGLPRPRWRYLDDPYSLRGRGSIRVAYGDRYFEHPAVEQIQRMLVAIEKRRPGSVETVEVPS